MRVTKYRKTKLITNMETDIPCPLCGETKSFEASDSDNWGVQRQRKTWFKRYFIFGLYKYEQDKYRCWTCGAEWKNEVKELLIKE